MKLTILTNTIAPYRIPIYSHLAERFDVVVLHGGAEPNRKEWAGRERAFSFVSKKSWGLQIPTSKRRNGVAIDSRALHITPGLIVDLLRIRPDAIISNEMGFRSVVALAYGTLFGVPVWVWWGGTCHTERHTSKLRRCVRRVLRYWVSHWISYGTSSTEYLLRLGVPRRRILQIQNCVDDRLFQPTGPKRFSLSPRPVVLHVGRLVRRKGISHLLKASAKLQREGQVFSLLIVGSGPEEGYLKSLASTLEIRYIHFEPALPPEDMPAVYRSADLLVFPTLEDVWGLVINEAMLCGLPVLCSKYAGCAHELLPPDRIFDPTDESGFVSALRRALEGVTVRPDTARVIPTAAVAEQLSAAICARCGF